jgi:hypothetical protein
MSLDLRRFQYLLGTPCDCQTVTYVDDDGAHVCSVRCCQRCWECGMLALQAETSRQGREVEMLQLEMDGVLEASSPPTP